MSPSDAEDFVSEAMKYQETMSVKNPLLFLYLSISVEMSRPLDFDGPYNKSVIDITTLIARKVSYSSNPLCFLSFLSTSPRTYLNYYCNYF